MWLTRRTVLATGGMTIAGLASGCIGSDEPTDAADDPELDDDTNPEEPAEDEDSDGPEPDDDVGDSEPEVDDDSAEETNDEDDTNGEPDDESTVTVGAGDDLHFDPETLEIEQGETVEFVWEADGHNVVVTDQPDEGTWDGVGEIQDEGYTHSNTFDVEGRYEYVCEPHEDAGMEGSVLVGDVASGVDDDPDEDDDSGSGSGY
ncbi:plastocyanin/azurin family copper-binding protein [Natronorarus salvus]|uniref:plastocyanin/azurin family copper-binding protein n=1 Tax=Natronorarus salvus TaxID=3117733 RepID=UPI002F260F8D